MSREFSECACSYQQEKAWGYTLFRWVRGKRSRWGILTSSASASQIRDAIKQVPKRHQILVTCRGCGADMVREHPRSSNSEPVSSHAGSQKDSGSETLTPQSDVARTGSGA